MLDDPTGPDGYRGWADRLVGQVEREQLPRALELAPDLATVFAGVDDLPRRSHDGEAVVASLERMLSALRATEIAPGAVPRNRSPVPRQVSAVACAAARA